MSVVRLSGAVAAGRFRAPPSKSYTHRALVSGHLAGRRYDIRRPLDSDDTRATAQALDRLGTTVHRGSGLWSLRPRHRSESSAPITVDCGESGTTLRFVAALAALESRPVTFQGSGRLPTRPVEALLRALRTLGATVRRGDTGVGLPFTVEGPIRSGSVALDVSESSQFASALLLVLPTLSGDSRLTLTGRLVSLPYIEATLAVLAHHRIRVERRGKVVRIPGGQRYARAGFSVPGDASSAAYFWVAAALTGGRVRVEGIPAVWPQADTQMLDVLERAGARVRRTSTGAEVAGGETLKPFRADLTDAPDLYPLAGVLAAAIPGRSELRGAPHVALKESDRRTETAGLVAAMGGKTRIAGGHLEIRGVARPRPFRKRTLSDHRLVMSAAVGALAARGTSAIGDGRAVAKSFPEFWTVLAQIAPGGVEA